MLPWRGDRRVHPGENPILLFIHSDRLIVLFPAWRDVSARLLVSSTAGVSSYVFLFLLLKKFWEVGSEDTLQLHYPGNGRGRSHNGH